MTNNADSPIVSATTTTTTTTQSIPPFALNGAFVIDNKGNANNNNHGNGTNAMTTGSKQKQNVADAGVLKIGDTISLFMDMSELSNNVNVNFPANSVGHHFQTSHTTFGFFTADGIITDRCGIVENREGEFVPPNFKECVFMVHTLKQYSARKQFRKALAKLDLVDFDYKRGGAMRLARQPNLQQNESMMNSSRTIMTGKGRTNRAAPSISPANVRNLAVTSFGQPSQKQNYLQMSNLKVVQISDDNYDQLCELQDKLDIEEKNNKIDAERSLGQPISYGQAIQLLHVKSGKFLTLARESADLQKECMKLVVDELGNSASYFSFLPFLRFKQEGEWIRIGDQIRVHSRKFNSYLHASPYIYANDTKGTREANMSTNLQDTKWKIRMYSRHLDKASKRLKAGDVIRIFHKELEGFLIAHSNDSDNSYTVKILSARESNSEDVYQMSQSMWEVEQDDPSRGGTINWNSQYHLKNVATGLYLCAQGDEDNDIVSEFDSDDDDTEIEHISRYPDDESSTPATSSSFTSSSKGKRSLRGRRGVTYAFGEAPSAAKVPAEMHHVSSSGNAMPSGEVPKRHSQDKSSSEQSRWVQLKRIMLPTQQPPPPRRPSFKSSINQLTKPSNIEEMMKHMPWSDNSHPRERGRHRHAELFLTEYVSNATLFSLLPTLKRKRLDSIAYSSYFRMRHVESSSWIHAVKIDANHESQYPISPLTRKSSVFAMNLDTNMECSPVMFEEDVFSMTLVPQDQVYDLNFVQAILPTLSQFTRKLAIGTAPTASQIEAIHVALTQLIIFVVDSLELDPMKREGTPFENRQAFLRERCVIDQCIFLVTLPFEKQFIHFDVVHLPENKSWKQMIQLSYRLIKQICKGNNLNGMYISQYIDILQHHIEHGLGAEDALLEILSDNYELLTHITFEQINYFVDLLQRSDKNPRYLSFLSALCSCNGKAVVKNQDIVAKLLFTQHMTKNVLILPAFSDDRQSISIIVNNDKVDLVTFIRNANLVRQIRGQARVHQAQKLVDFFENTIRLFADLCLGRNMNSKEKIEKLLAYDLVVQCIKMEELQTDLRSSFCDFLLHCYVDCAPFERKPMLSLSRKWNEIDDTRTDHRVQTFKELKFFLKIMFQKSKILDLKFMSRNKFVLTLIRVCRFLFEFNIYRDVREISTVFDPLLRILDGVNDQNGGMDMQPSLRYSGATESGMIIFAIKIEILKIAHIVMDIRLDRRVTKMMKHFKRYYDAEAIVHGNVIGRDMQQRDSAMLEELFNDLRFSSQLVNLDELLLDLTRYDDKELSTLSLHLLLRSSQQKEELAAVLPNVELLVSRSMIQAFDKLSAATDKLRLLLRHRLNVEEMTTVDNIINSMIHDIHTNGSASQRILRNLSVHEICVAALHSNFFKPKIEYRIYNACVRLLTEFIRDNPENQKLIFPHIDFFMDIMDNNGIDVSHLLYETVHGNRSMCLAIEEKQIRQWINIIANHGMKGRYLNFLRAMVSIKGKPLKRNQTLVTKEMLDRKADVIVLFLDEDDLTQRNQLIREKEYLQPDGKLCYHINLLRLFFDCTEGKNYSSEVKLQSLLSLEHLIGQLADPHTSLVPALRECLMRFVDEVFINTEKQSMDVNNCDKLWHMFEKFNEELDHYLHGDIDGRDKRCSTFAIKPFGIVDNEDMIDEQRDPLSETVIGATTVDGYYLFNLMLPFIQHYFQRHFSLLEDFTADRKDLVEELVEKVIRLYRMTANPNHRQIIKKLIGIMIGRARMPDGALSHLKGFVRDTAGRTQIKCTPSPIAATLDEHDEKISVEYSLYVKEVAKKLRNSSNFLNVAKMYYNAPTTLLETLVRVLRRILDTKYHDERSAIVSLDSLRTMKNMLLLPTNDEEHAALLDRFIDASAPDMVLELITSNVDAVVKETLIFGISVLEGRIKSVQQVIFNAFAAGNREDFFISIRERIRKSIAEIKERRYFEKRREERKLALRESTSLARNSDLHLSPLPTEDTTAEELREFKEKGFILLIMRFLQLLCEGHNFAMQEYLRQQHNNANASVDLVHESLSYLLALEKYIDHSNIDIAIQCFDTLSEFVQGPCPNNQHSLGVTKLFFVANDILSMDLLEKRYTSNLTFLDSVKLKRKVVVMLISLLEGYDSHQVADLMVNSLHFNTIFSELKKCADVCQGKLDRKVYDLVQIQSKDDRFSNHYDEHEGNLSAMCNGIKAYHEKLGIELHVLVSQIMDGEKIRYGTSSVKKMLNKNLYLQPNDINVFRSQTTRIEILRSGNLEHTYFRVPSDCKFLSKKSRDEFVETCNRDNSQSKVRDLFVQTDKFRLEMEYYASTSKKRRTIIWPFVQRYWSIFKLMSFMWAVFMNVFIMLTYKKVYNTVDGDIPIPGETGFWSSEVAVTSELSTPHYRILCTIFGLIQLAFTLILLVTYVIYFLKLKIIVQFDLGKYTHWKELKSDFSFTRRFIWYVLHDTYTWFIWIHLVITIMGLCVNSLFFCLHLFEVVIRFGSLTTVLKSVTTNRKQLILTFLLLTITILVFSYPFFAFFGNDFVSENDTKLCNSAFMCFLAVFNFGLRTGGLWEDYFGTGHSMNAGRIVIDVMFYLLVSVLVSSVMEGIIVDSFAQLRQQRMEQREIIQNKCHICDIHRSRFDQKANEGVTFERHIVEDHNMWNYVYFLIYLYRKEPTEYTGTEQYVAEMVNRDDISFFPILRSLMLEESDRRSEKTGSTGESANTTSTAINPGTVVRDET